MVYLEAPPWVRSRLTKAYLGSLTPLAEMALSKQLNANLGNPRYRSRLQKLGSLVVGFASLRLNIIVDYNLASEKARCNLGNARLVEIELNVRKKITKFIVSYIYLKKKKKNGRNNSSNNSNSNELQQ